MPHCDEVSVGRACMGIDLGVAVLGTPSRKFNRINYGPDAFHSLGRDLFLGLFREDQPVIERPGQIVGVFKDG